MLLALVVVVVVVGCGALGGATEGPAPLPVQAAPSDAQLETGHYDGGSPGQPIDLNGDGQYGVGDYEAREDPGVDDDYDGRVDELGETCPDGCDPRAVPPGAPPVR